MQPVSVFYTPRQSTPKNRSYSPSAGKPALVVAEVQRLGLPVEIVEPRAATLTDLCRAHDCDFVRAVLGGRLPNGFGNSIPEVTQTLPWTVGSMLSAAEHAVTTGRPAWSPTSGFHHAGWDYEAAFCTFNGLMVAALTLHVVGAVRRVAILDLDEHFGDGTRDIIRRLDLDWVQHHTYGAEPATVETAEVWLESLPALVEETIRGADLVLYQAGVDPHVRDPLGGGLSTEQLARRDRTVFRVCRDEGVPVAFNLAGGYQRPVEKVVDLHVATLRALLEVYSGEPGVSP
jgi:acetoin utilization deacetylase AcuC-like enzyme